MTRLPTLDEAETAAWADGENTRFSSRQFRDNRELSTRQAVIGSCNCWCGELPGHSWPGKADGAPHPRGPRR